jgi:predicted nucleotidyltransferase
VKLDVMIVNSSEILNQIEADFRPEKIIMFGSRSKGVARPDSDIDLCVVIETENKRRTATDLYYTVDCEVPIDFLLYTPREWQQCIADNTSFAYKILQEGIVLYDRQ